jgi:hypothetical protein
MLNATLNKQITTIVNAKETADASIRLVQE